MLGQRHTASRPHKCRTRLLHQCGIPMTAGRIFRALPWLVACIDIRHGQWHLQIEAGLTAMRIKAIRCGLQTMVHMNGVHLPRPALHTRMQQRGGVCATTVGHGHRQGGRKR